MPRKREITPEQMKKILEMSKQKPRPSRKEIAKAIGLSKDTVHRYQVILNCLYP